MDRIVKLLESNRFFYALIISFLFWHLWSIDLSPLPWFDEVFFASIAKSFSEGQGFLLESCSILYEGKEVLTYGPVYFFLTDITTSLGGLNVFAFRIVNFSFGALSIYIFFKILRKQGLSILLSRVLVLLLCLDVIFIQNSHSGRMDLVALFFLLLSILVFLTDSNSLKSNLYIAFFTAFAILTTPRIAVLICPFLCFVIIHNLKFNKWSNIFLLIFIPSVIYLCWIFYGFGSLSNFLDYYLGGNVISSDKASLVEYFLLGNFKIPFFQWPIILTGVVSFIYILVNNKELISKSILFLMPIIFFYILVKDTGVYSALISPFWYILIGFGLIGITKRKIVSNIRIGLILAFIIFIVNSSIFFLKVTVIVLDQEKRDSGLIEKWLSDKLPEGSMVVGDFRYYYAVTNNNSDFQFIEWGKTLEERAAYHSGAKIVDYLIASNDLSDSYIKAYKKHYNIEEMQEFKLHSKENLILTKIRSFIPNVNSSYEGTLFKLSLKESEKN